MKTHQYSFARLCSRWFRKSQRPIIDQPTRGTRRLIGFERLEEKALLATFAIIGDFASNGAATPAVADMVKSWNPDAILSLGDNTLDGSAAVIDDNIGQHYHQYIGNYQGGYGAGAETNRFFPVLGNHDWETANAAAYFDYFTLPGNERYYDFVIENVHFFAVDSDPHEPDGNTSDSAQAQWLQNALASSQEEFNVVYFHHPPYTSSNNGPSTNMRWPLQQWGADVVLAGHAHQYERLDIGGVPYFVNGLGGAEIADFSSPATGSQVRYNANFGAMRLVTDSHSAHFEFLSIDNNGTVIDSYTLNAGQYDNDDFAQATLLSGTSINVGGTNVAASFEASEPYNIGSTGGKSVWWSWKAAAAGSVTVATAGSSFDTTLGVYTGSAVNSLTKVAANDDASGSLLTSNLTFSALAGQTYYLSVDGYAGASGQIALQLNTTPAPVNDAFSTPSTLEGTQITASGNNSAATIETGEPRNAGVVGGKSVWWSWTPDTSGTVTISTAGSMFDTTLGVYTGTSLESLTSVIANDDQSSSVLTSRVQFAAIAGRTYYLSVDGYRGASGDIRLSLDLAASPVNDNFADRTALSGTTVNVVTNNALATRESGEPRHANVDGGRSLWWTWAAPTSGTVSVSTAGSSFDTTLGVYTGQSVSTLTTVAANDDLSGSNRNSRVQFTAVAGTVYQIAVDGYRAAYGDISLSILLAAPPLNDTFANRTQLSGTSISASGSNVNASLEANEPRHANAPGGRSVWWSWTAPSSGMLTISLAGSSFDTTLGVYTGSSLNDLVAVASDDDESGSVLTSRVQFAAVAGRTYHLAVDGYSGAEGQIALALNLVG